MCGEITASSLEGPRSVEDLLNVHDVMSIPHFQRGLVWDTSSVALLLESLFYATPCGSIILWEPANVSAQGIALGQSPQYLIVDGQQRIRSLHGVFRDKDDGENQDSVMKWGDGADGGDQKNSGDVDEGGDEDNGVWCLNLGRVPEFTEFSGGKRFRLFRRAKDPRNQDAKQDGKVRGAPLQDRKALLPLRWFLDHTKAEIRARIGQEGPDRAVAKAAEAVLQNELVNGRLRQMLKRSVFQVSVLGSQRSLADVIGIYNRINSAGKRVEAEEKAFANLVGECGETHNSLEDFFRRAAKGTGQEAKKNTHDDLLRRQRESRFGFKLFMRTFVLALAYHTDRTVGSTTFSFDSANPETLREAHDHLQPILETTVNLLAYVATTTLRQGLPCDDLRMLPETASLWPVFQLLIRFPGLMAEGTRAALSSIVLRLILADLKKSELLRLCTQVNHAQSAKDALALFNNHRELSPASIRTAIQAGVDGAQSLTARYTLVLYWLLRSQHAKDFLDEGNASKKGMELKRSEPALCEQVSPEKQHIVPYSRLKDVFKLHGARPGRHEVHDIGNLTYISSWQNSFETGVGSRPLQLANEPPANLDAHLLGGAGLLKAYKGACKHPDSRIARRHAKDHYREFCRLRREAIKEKLIEWEMELRSANDDPDVLRLIPAVRLINPQIDDDIRGLRYPAAVAECLIRLCDQNGMQKVLNKKSYLSISYRLKTPGKPGVQVLRIDLQEDGTMLGLKLAGAKLRAKFRRRYPEKQVGTGKKSVCHVETGDENAAGVVAVLNWIAKQLSPPIGKAG